MKNHTALIIPYDDPENQALAEKLTPYCGKSTHYHSITGLEYTTLILAAGDLLLALLALPQIMQLIERGNVTLKICNQTVKGTPKQIAKKVLSIPGTREALPEALKNHQLLAEGDIDAVVKLNQLLQELCEEEGLYENGEPHSPRDTDN